MLAAKGQLLDEVTYMFDSLPLTINLVNVKLRTPGVTSAQWAQVLTSASNCRSGLRGIKVVHVVCDLGASPNAAGHRQEDQTAVAKNLLD